MHGSEAYFVIGEGLLTGAATDGAAPGHRRRRRGRRAAVPLLPRHTEGTQLGTPRARSSPSR